MYVLARWNPLRKKSGLMSVMHAQTKKNRVVSKHGRINTFRRKEEVRHDKHRYIHWRNSIHESQACSYLLLQIPEGLLHLNDWTLLVLDSVQLCCFFLHILAWLCCCLVHFFLLPSFLFGLHSPCFQTRYIVVLTHGDLRDDLEDGHVVRIRSYL